MYYFHHAMLCYAKSLQSCPTLCDPIDSSPPGSPVPGILQARTLEWVAISSSNAWKWKVKVKSLSLVQPLATPWTAAHQAPPSMGLPRLEHWSGVPLSSLCVPLVGFVSAQHLFDQFLYYLLKYLVWFLFSWLTQRIKWYKVNCLICIVWKTLWEYIHVSDR